MEISFPQIWAVINITSMLSIKWLFISKLSDNKSITSLWTTKRREKWPSEKGLNYKVQIFSFIAHRSGLICKDLWNKE